MGIGAGLYMCDVVVKSSRSLSHLLMSSCYSWNQLKLIPLASRLRLCTRNLPQHLRRCRTTYNAVTEAVQYNSVNNCSQPIALQLLHR